jgi:hypothetical protein
VSHWHSAEAVSRHQVLRPSVRTHHQDRLNARLRIGILPNRLPVANIERHLFAAFQTFFEPANPVLILLRWLAGEVPVAVVDLAIDLPAITFTEDHGTKRYISGIDTDEEPEITDSLTALGHGAKYRHGVIRRRSVVDLKTSRNAQRRSIFCRLSSAIFWRRYQVRPAAERGAGPREIASSPW